ncbi:hypothetical protein CEY00_Acc19935 [Actinidia chinensis var. chinensis]|uniref:DUF7054 domain-containing protein n=1 Tax=Actinidia chinensis var. chinensis TaxID=1590841 RepID=A0A2R6Q883_ACTCC|nr:hypothetical protein CEY00_Acc19935 [Actinidia chinensis var. chinensis]
MPEKSLRQRIPVSSRPARSPQSSQSPRRRAPAAQRRPSKPSRPIRILQRCKSESSLLYGGLVAGGDLDRRILTVPDAVLFRPPTWTDVFSSSESLPPPSPQQFEGYRKDSKVVVNVTVEGSAGPIRTMVKLGSSVDETIRLVINKYSEEGRRPQLEKDAASTFELHHSYFSLQCLSKSEMIGDVGSRSFYLRKGNSEHSSNGDITISASLTSEIVSSTPVPSTPSPPLFCFPPFIAWDIRKIIRRTRKLWKILGCMHCNG